MKSKVTELGVFCTGLGAVLIAFSLYVWHMLANPGMQPTPLQWTMLVGPGTLMSLAGILTLVVRSRSTVQISAGITLLMFLVDALLSLSLVKWAITAIGMIAVWKTSQDALEELKPQSQA